MKPECLNQGSCILCGCSTPALQMTNKACDLPCYPKIMSKVDWNLFLNEEEEIIENKHSWRFLDESGLGKKQFMRIDNKTRRVTFLFPNY